jgi:hypothetical protein
MDKTQTATAMTRASISDDKRDLNTDTSVYQVDFLGCMKGFLSRKAKNLFGFETREQVAVLTTTLERFMDYLLQHDVCPEYRSDVLAARALCRDAPPELWDVAELTRRLPGDFNMACSTLFGGFYQNYDGETWWGPENFQGSVFVGLKPEEASQIVHFAVAGAASEEVFRAYMAAVDGHTQLQVTSVREEAGLEITRIIPPTPECKDIYHAHSKHFRPVGRVHAKLWTDPDAPPEDLTETERQSLVSPSVDATEYVFFVESILQSSLRVGMKLQATVRTLNCGIAYFDAVRDVFPTFDEYLANDMMVGYKPPRPEKGAFDYVQDDGDDDQDAGDDDNNPEGDDDENEL